MTFPMPDQLRRIEEGAGQISEVPELGGPPLMGPKRSAKAKQTPSPRRQNFAVQYNLWWKQYNAGLAPPASQSQAFARIMDRFVDEVPQLEELLSRDFTVALAYAENRFTMDSVYRSGIIDGIPATMDLSDKIFAATDAQLADMAFDLFSAEAVLAQNASYRQALDVMFGSRAEGPSEVDGPLERVRAEFSGIEGAAANKFLDRFSGREIEWAVVGNRAVAAVDIPDGTGEGTYYFDVELDEPIGDTLSDLLLAVTEAAFGKRHTLRRADDMPGQQTMFGAIFEMAGQVVNPVFSLWDRIDHPLNALLGAALHPTEGPSWQSSRDIVEQRTRRAVEQAGSYVDVDSDTVIADLVSTLAPPDTPLPELAAMGIAFRAGIPDDEWARISADLTDARTEAVAEAVESLADDRHSGQRFLSQATEAMMDAALLWERFVQNNIVSTVDFFNDAARGVWRSTIEGGGFAAFTEAFDGTEAENLADYWNVPDEYRGIVNLFGAIAGDPFTWIGVGAVTTALRTQRQLTTKAGVAQFLAEPRTQVELIGMMRTARTAGDTRTLAATAGRMNMSVDGIHQILQGMPIEMVVYKEMTEGLMLPTLDGGFKMRNSAVVVRSMSALGDTKFADAMRRHWSQLSAGRTVSLGRDDFFQGALEWGVARSTVGKWADNPALFDAWLDDLLIVTAPNRALARRSIGMRAETLAASRTELNREATRQGHRRFLRAEEELAETQTRIAALEGEASVIRRELDSGISARAGRLTELENTVDVLRNADTKIAQARAAFETARASGDDTAIATARQQLDDTIAAVRDVEGVPLPEGLGMDSAEYTSRRAAADDWLTRRRANHAEFERLRRIRRRVDVAGDEREVFESFLRDMADDWAEEAGLRAADGTIDWRRMLGHEPAEGVIPSLGQLIDPLSPDLRWALHDAGLTRLSQVTMPASPMQLVAYAARHSDGFWNKVIGRTLAPETARAVTFAEARASNHALKSVAIVTGDKLRRMWMANVLFNPFTAIRSNLDEVFRDIFKSGWSLRRPLVEDAVNRGLMGPVSTRSAPVRGAERVMTAFTGRTAALSDEANLFMRRLQLPFSNPDASPYVYVSKSRSAATETLNAVGLDTTVNRGVFLNSGRRFLNGVLPESTPGLRVWAQARQAGDDTIFSGWWFNENGRQMSRRMFDMTSGTFDPQNWGGAMEALDQMADVLLSQVPAAQRAAVRQRLLRAWATGSNVSDNTILSFKSFPSFEARPPTVIGQGFDHIFGRPHAVHGARIGEDYYNQARAILLLRHQESGKLLDAARVADLTGLSPEMAQYHLTRSSPMIDDLVRRSGYVTEKMIGVAARRTARTYMEHMQYQMMASTLGGRRLAQAFPFLRAQMDFLGFWQSELARSTELMLNPAARKVLERIPGVGRLIDDTTPFIGKPLQLPGVPLNLRLAGRIADYAGTVAELGEAREGDDIFQQIMSDYTFIPADIGDDMWMVLTPGLAPLPSWALHMMPLEVDDDETGFFTPLARSAAAVRRFLDATYPAFDFYSEQAGMTDLFDFVLPDGRRTLRRIAERGGEVAVTEFTNILNDWLGTSLPTQIDLGRLLSGNVGGVWNDAAAPPGYYQNLRVAAAQAVAENPNLDMTSDEYRQFRDELINDVWRDSVRGGAIDTAKSLFEVTGFRFDADDGQFLDQYQPVIDNLDRLNGLGFVDDSLRDEINGLWDSYQRGDMNYDQATRLADRLSLAFFDLPDNMKDLMVVQYPELTANMVSQWVCDPDKAPESTCRGDRLVVAPGEDGRKLREKGRRQRWLTRRDDTDFVDQTRIRYAEAARRLRSSAWNNITGLASWTGQDPSTKVSEATYTIQGWNLMSLAALGAPIEDGATSVKLTGQEIWSMLKEAVDPLKANRSSVEPLPLAGKLANTPVPDMLRRIEDRMEERGFDPDDPALWDEEGLSFTRRLFDAAITDGYITPAEYDRYFAPRYGVMDYEPPSPPSLDATDFHITANPADIEVLDGDTVRVHFADGQTQRIRIIGINAAEQFRDIPELHERYLSQTEDLSDLLNSATEVAFAIWAPERFMVTQEVADGEVRWLMWLYVDGDPIWDPNSFTSRTPTGYRRGGEGVNVVSRGVGGDE